MFNWDAYSTIYWTGKSVMDCKLQICNLQHAMMNALNKVFNKLHDFWFRAWNIFLIKELNSYNEPKCKPKLLCSHSSTNFTLEPNKFKRWRQPIPFFQQFWLIYSNRNNCFPANQIKMLISPPISLIQLIPLIPYLNSHWAKIGRGLAFLGMQSEHFLFFVGWRNCRKPYKGIAKL